MYLTVIIPLRSEILIETESPGHNLVSQVQQLEHPIGHYEEAINIIWTKSLGLYY